ncbi:MAG: hypothetical protein AAGI38_21525 [Bacteroidota bacterium]
MKSSIIFILALLSLTFLSAQSGTVEIDGDDNDGTTAALQIRSANNTQTMLLDGNEIDALSQGLFLNNNVNLPIYLGRGRGPVTVNTVDTSAMLTIAARKDKAYSFRIADSSGRSYVSVDRNNNFSVNTGFFNVGFNMRAGAIAATYNSGIFQVEDDAGADLIEVRADGDFSVLNNISKGGGSFKIDHPLDPENKYLYHSFVESPDMMNVYNGNITTDASGMAVVTLPDYFEALNRDFRYQLTVMGTFAQAIIKEKVNGNEFTIQTSEPNVEVSWQVTGIRHDPYANMNRIPESVEKAPNEKGFYLHPAAYDKPASMQLDTDGKVE